MVVGLSDDALDDTLITGLLMTDTVLVADPCIRAVLDTVGEIGIPKMGRLVVFASVVGTAACAVVTGASVAVAAALALLLKSCRLPNNRFSRSLSRAWSFSCSFRVAMCSG